MGTVRQKRKRMSNAAAVKRKPKSKKRHLANPIVAENWNKKETLTQNYRRLGLVSKLNKSAGGVERVITGSRTDPALKEQLSSKPAEKLIIEKGRPTEMHVDEVEVERDEEGRILRVITKQEKSNPLHDPLNDLDDSEPEMLDQFSHVPKIHEGDSSVVRALGEKATNGARKEPRKQSTREKDWVQRLVEKHGDNYKAMFRDRRLNPLQQSEGDIRSRVQKYLQSKG